ncbi:hypothetical protein OG216_28175 [Streptomycetaceae bacterium NBC_01309]
MSNPSVDPSVDPVDPSGPARDIPLWQRVVWTLVPVATVGFGAWLPFAYLAYRDHRRNSGPVDHRWWLGFAVASAVELVLVFARPDEGAVARLAGGYVLLLMATATVVTWVRLSQRGAGR